MGYIEISVQYIPLHLKIFLCKLRCWAGIIYGCRDSSIFAKYFFAHSGEQAADFQRNMELSFSQSGQGVNSLPHIRHFFFTLNAINDQVPEVGGTAAAACQAFRLERMGEAVAAKGQFKLAGYVGSLDN